MQPVYLDFETEGIEARPKYPPKPVGLAIYDPENGSTYNCIIEMKNKYLQIK
jgi:hypothetical protein